MFVAFLRPAAILPLSLHGTRRRSYLRTFHSTFHSSSLLTAHATLLTCAHRRTETPGRCYPHPDRTIVAHAVTVDAVVKAFRTDHLPASLLPRHTYARLFSACLRFCLPPS